MNGDLPPWPEHQRVDDPIYRVEEITVGPGHRGSFAEQLGDVYLPAVARQGHTLLHVWVDPPLEVADRPSTFIVSWHIDGTAGFWKAKRVAAADPAIPAFWASVAVGLVGRTMRFVRGVLDLDPTERRPV